MNPRLIAKAFIIRLRVACQDFSYALPCLIMLAFSSRKSVPIPTRNRKRAGQTIAPVQHLGCRQIGATWPLYWPHLHRLLTQRPRNMAIGAYSPRALPGFPVAAPLTRKDVGAGDDG